MVFCLVSGVTQRMYRQMVKWTITLPWECKNCSLQTVDTTQEADPPMHAELKGLASNVNIQDLVISPPQISTTCESDDSILKSTITTEPPPIPPRRNRLLNRRRIYLNVTTDDVDQHSVHHVDDVQQNKVSTGLSEITFP